VQSGIALSVSRREIADSRLDVIARSAGDEAIHPSARVARSTRRKPGSLTAGTASGPNGLVRKNYGHLTNLDDANLSPCAVNGGLPVSPKGKPT
jgi:hypothetical protein